MHDAWELLPVASSLEGCVRLRLLANHGRVENLVETAKTYGINISDIPVPEPDDDGVPSLDGPPWTEIEAGGIEFWGASSAGDLPAHDPGSPHLLFVAAKEAIANQRLAEAEAHLTNALAHLPDYSEAMALLAQVYRRQQDHHRSADLLMQAITSPRCFGAWDRQKLLQWLQRLGDDGCGSSGDPLWRRRRDLTFVEGVKEKDDYGVFEELIEDYHRLGMGVRAVRLRILTGEMMGRETVSFRERSNWTEAKYESMLKADLERSGLHARLMAIER